MPIWALQIGIHLWKLDPPHSELEQDVSIFFLQALEPIWELQLHPHYPSSFGWKIKASKTPTNCAVLQELSLKAQALIMSSGFILQMGEQDKDEIPSLDISTGLPQFVLLLKMVAKVEMSPFFPCCSIFSITPFNIIHNLWALMLILRSAIGYDDDFDDLRYIAISSYWAFIFNAILVNRSAWAM